MAGVDLGIDLGTTKIIIYRYGKGIVLELSLIHICERVGFFLGDSLHLYEALGIFFENVEGFPPEHVDNPLSEDASDAFDGPGAQKFLNRCRRGGETALIDFCFELIAEFGVGGVGRCV